jgi:Holliday junction resolvasome RuvABC endonuclease subunit
MQLKIISIDASLSSTGLSIAECDFLEGERDFLFSTLINPTVQDVSRLDKSFHLGYTTEIKEDKATAKELAKVRKSIRTKEDNEEQPDLKDLVLEEELSTKKILDQVTQIMDHIRHEEINPLPTFAFIEDYSYHSQGSITQLAEMKGHLKTEMYRYKPQFKFYYLTANINTVKKVGGRNGNANKELVCEELKRFGFQCDIKQDDAADSIAIALAAFYAMYNRIFPFFIPTSIPTKDKKYQKTFIDSLTTFGNRIASRTDLLGIVNG